MDGVLIRGDTAVPGAGEVIAQWLRDGTEFLVVTNDSGYTPGMLAARLKASGVDVPAERIWTSALATADFLRDQQPGASAYAIGESGLFSALEEAGVAITEQHPDYVVVGETRTYSFEAVTTAIRLIVGGARFIATNPDATGPSEDGIVPRTGALSALITSATGRAPYVVGKPSPMMVRSALNRIGARSEVTGMVGDRMDTDVIAGIEAGLHTVLVLTGSTASGDIETYPYRPTEVLAGIRDLLEPSAQH